MKKTIFAMLLGVGLLGGCGVQPGESEATAKDQVREAEVYTDHAIVTCQSATLYGNYSPTAGPRDPIAVLGYGNKVGIRQDAGYPSWAVVLDYGPDVWGFMLRSCMTRCYGVNNPIAGCF
jgi:hypothetical protein